MYEKVSVALDVQVTISSLRIRDDEGDTVALVNSAGFVNATIEPDGSHVVPAGSLLLKGRAFIGLNADRSSSQGI